MAETTSSTRRGLATFFLLVLIFAVPAAVLYTSLVLRQLREVGERNVRLVDKVARRVEAVLANATRTVESLTKDFSYACEFDERQPYLSLAEPSDCTEVENKVELAEPTEVEWKTRLRLEHARLLVELHREVDDENAGKGEEGKKTLGFTVELGRILEDAPLNGAFDALVIADHGGHVVHRSAAHSAGIRLDRLGPFSLGPGGSVGDGDGEKSQGKGITFGELQQASRVLEAPLVGESYRLYCQPLRLPADGQVSERKSAPTREEAPDDANTTAEADDSGTWVVCGMVSASETLSEALLVSPRLVLVLGLILLFSLAAWPLIKLAFLSRRERFKLIDTYLLMLGTFGTLLLATIMLLDADGYLHLKKDSKKALEKLAKRVEDNLSGELVRLHDQLSMYDRHLCGLETSITTRNTSDHKPPLFIDKLMLGPPGPTDGEERRIRFPQPACYENFSSVFWMNDDGWQFVKGTVRERNTPQVNLFRRKNPRQYFTRVRERNLWSYERELRDAPRRFFVEPFRSITTGEHHSALSIPSCLTGLQRLERGLGTSSRLEESELDQAGPIVAAAISAAPMAVTDPVLPLGFGFAIVEPGGGVLYHSDGRRALDERLPDEVGDPERLRSALRSRTARHFDTSYTARPHQIYVHPLEDLPWSAVAFRDGEVLHTVNLETVGHALILAAAYFFIYLLTLTIVLLFARGRRALRPTWMWPTPDRLRLYIRLTAGYAVLLLVMLAALWSPGAHSLASSLLVPLLAASWTCFIYWNEKPPGSDASGTRRPKSQGRQYLFWYYLAAALIWLLVAVLPAASFFKAAWEDQIKRLVKAEDLGLMEELEARSCRIKKDYRDLADRQLESRLAKEEDDAQVGDEQILAIRERFEDLRQRREESELDLYLESSFDRRRAGETAAGDAFEAALHPKLLRALARRKPVYNETSLRLRYLQPTAADDGSWKWRVSGDRVSFEATGLTCGGSVRLATMVPRLSPSPGPVCAIGGIVLLVALWLWNLYCGRNIFFVRIARRSQRESLEPETPGGLTTLRDALAALLNPRDPERVERKGREWLRRELGADRRLARLVVKALRPRRQVLRWLVRLAGEDPREARERVLEAAAGHYQALWTACSDDEQLVLAQLADEGFVNPQQALTVRGLLQRGLVVRAPDLRPMNDSFTLFVRRFQDPEKVAGWEQPAGALAWKQLRWVFLSILIAIAAFLFFTQKDLFDRTIAFISALVVAIPGLLQLLRSWALRQ